MYLHSSPSSYVSPLQSISGVVIFLLQLAGLYVQSNPKMRDESYAKYPDYALLFMPTFLGIFFLVRYFKSMKFMPSGLMFIMSVLTVVIYLVYMPVFGPVGKLF